MAFSTKIKGNHHLQGNVQAYNIRMPVTPRRVPLVLFLGMPSGMGILLSVWLIASGRPNISGFLLDFKPKTTKLPPNKNRSKLAYLPGGPVECPSQMWRC